MNKEELLKEKQQLEQQREQTIAQFNQIIGALTMIDKYIKNLDDIENKVKKDGEDK